MGEQPQKKRVVMNDGQLAETIEMMLRATGHTVDKAAILAILRYQQQHLENIGAIRIIYHGPQESNN